MKTATLISFLLALAASILFLVIPTYNGETRSTDAQGHTTVTRTQATLLEVNGRWTLLSLGVPVLIALIPVLIPKRGVRIGAAILLGVFAIIGGFSIGLFYVPSALTMIVAAVLPH
jgi:hypothetical protein